MRIFSQTYDFFGLYVIAEKELRGPYEKLDGQNENTNSGKRWASKIV